MIEEEQAQPLGLPFSEEDLPESADPVEEPLAGSELEMPSGELFKLLNIHLIDSLSRGRVQTMAIDGGTALTGRNGKGKTSLLSLALMFIGVEPTYLVSRGKDSFIEFYLPNPTSYIAYEYQRPNGELRMVVAYGNTTSDKVHFRFVKHGFLREMFVTDDDQFVLNKDFRRRLSDLKIPCADKQITTYQDYRYIIQYWQPGHYERPQKAELHALSHDYAFTTYGKSLRHLEKLTRGMFSREANFDVLRQVVADWVFDGRPGVSIQHERKKVETWPRDYRAYKQIMGIKPLVETAQDVQRQIDTAFEAIRELKEQFIFVEGHLTELLGKQRDDETRLQGQLAEKLDQHNIKATDIQGRIKGIEVKIESIETALREIGLKREEYQKQDILKKRTETGQLELFLTQLSSTRKQLDVLQGEFEHINQKYDRLILDEQGRLVTFQKQANGRIQQLAEEERLALVPIEIEVESDVETYQETVQPELQRLADLINKLNQDVGAALAGKNNPPDNPELSAAVEAKSAESHEAVSKAFEIREQLSVMDAEKVSGQSQLDKYEAAIEAADKAIRAQEAVLSDIIQAHTPNRDTLLFFLRESRPEWARNIAKVINPDLLQRTDLSPQQAELVDSFFGVALDLDQLDPAKEADESKLQELIAEAEEELAERKRLKDVAIERRDTLVVSMGKRAEEASRLRSQQVQANSRSQTLGRELNELKAQLENFRRDASVRAHNHWADTVVECNKATELQNKFTGEVAAKVADIRSQGDAKRTRLRSEFMQKRNDLQRSIGEQDLATQNAIKKLKDTQTTELKGAGADVDVITRLKDEVETLQGRITEIEGWQQLIAEWKYWHDHVECTEPELQRELSELGVQLLDTKAELGRVNADWERIKDDINRAIVSTQEAIRTITEDLGITTGVLKNDLESYRPTDQYLQFDPAWRAPVLRSALGTKLSESRKLHKEIEHQVGKMELAFLSMPMSPPSDYLQDRLGILRDENDGDVTPRMKLRLIEEWFSGHHEGSRLILSSDASSIHSSVSSMHRELKRFTDKISRFNSGLQEHLTRSSQVFDSITDLQVSLFSAVEDLDYWPTISKITNARDEWIDNDNLPSEEAVAELLQLLENWDIKTGIQADFKALVSIRGSVRENGNVRHFRNKVELENISSNGLSYLVLICLFLGFLSKARGSAPVQLTWCLDELKAIDDENTVSLTRYLSQNFITLCTAFPEPDAETLMLFENKYKLDAERRLVTCELAVDGEDEDHELVMEEN